MFSHLSPVSSFLRSVLSFLFLFLQSCIGVGCRSFEPRVGEDLLPGAGWSWWGTCRSPQEQGEGSCPWRLAHQREGALWRFHSRGRDLRGGKAKHETKSPLNLKLVNYISPSLTYCQKSVLWRSTSLFYMTLCVCIHLALRWPFTYPTFQSLLLAEETSVVII